MQISSIYPKILGEGQLYLNKSPFPVMNPWCYMAWLVGLERTGLLWFFRGFLWEEEQFYQDCRYAFCYQLRSQVMRPSTFSFLLEVTYDDILSLHALCSLRLSHVLSHVSNFSRLSTSKSQAFGIWLFTSAQPQKRFQVNRSHVKKCQDVRFTEETAMKLYVEVGVGCCQPLECRLKFETSISIRILQVRRVEGSVWRFFGNLT